MLRRSTAALFSVDLAFACSNDDDPKTGGGTRGGDAGSVGRTGGSTSTPSSGGSTAGGIGGQSNAGTIASAGVVQGQGGDVNAGSNGFAGGDSNAGATNQAGGYANDAGTTGFAGTVGTPIVTSAAYGQLCQAAGDCCSRLCDLSVGACVSAISTQSG